MTTKGDLQGYSTVAARVPVGSNGQVLTADSTNALGLSWQAGGGTNNVTSGSGVPSANCTPGSGTFIYFDTALTNAGTAFYFCSATNVWSPWFALDGNLLLSYTGANGVPVISINTTAICPLTSSCTYTGAVTAASLQVHNGNLVANGTTPTTIITGSGCAGTISGTNLSGTIAMSGGGTCTVAIVASTSVNTHYLCPVLQNRNSGVMVVQKTDSVSTATFAPMTVTTGDVLQYGTCSGN